MRGVEDAGFFAGLGFIFTRPGGGAGLLGFVGRGILGHAIERLAFSEDGEGVIGDANIGTCHSEGVVSDSGEDDVALLRGKNLNAGGLLVVSAVVSNPSVSENLVAEAFFEFLALILEAVVGVFFACRDFEGVGGCPESNDGTAAIDVVGDVFHLVIGEIEEAGEDDHEIGCLEGFETVDGGGPGFDEYLLINAEANGGFETVVLGEDAGKSGAGFLGAILVVRGDEDDVLSAASCTTNAIVPVLKLMNDLFGINSGHVESIHSYTNDQNLTDNFHDKDRRGRSAPLNMVITETGAASAVAKALPELEGKLTGSAIRVPTPNVSLAILNLNLDTDTTKEAINQHLRSASLDDKLHEQIEYRTSNELVSSDLVGSERTSIVDGPATIADGKRCVLYVWYDNEMGYSYQVIRILQDLAGLRYPQIP